MAQIDITALDPVDAFTKTLRNMLEITEVFKKNQDLPPLDLLRAYGHAKEVLEAINFITMTSINQQVRDRIPEDVVEAYKAEKAAEDLARLDEDTEARFNRLRRLLQPFSMEFDIDSDDIPPGFYRSEDL